ncbi:MAG: helix-turn-helix domain-containing protein [Candidatus Bathyarchaeia archaeon]
MKWTEAKRKKIIKLYEKGYTMSEIGAKMGASPSVIRYILIDAGIKPRPISKALLPNGWRKLVRTKGTASRILSLPASILVQLGVDPSKELRGKWEIRNGELILKLKEEEEARAKS